jgi:poly(3-hydroxybutyrate) depolymerase
MMGGPVDTRRSPTAVNQLAEERGLEWFRRNCILTVPPGHPGAFRQVYPGFLQLSGFMAMNLDRHVTAHRDMFDHLVRGDGDRAEKHREFYDEYLAVMDLTAEFYLQTVEKVFVTHELPKGEMMHRNQPVDLLAIRRCAIMAVEGEKDDISGVGQTLAALELTPNLPAEKKTYLLQKGVGHYGVFNGSRFRSEIAPRVRDFILTHGRGAAERPKPAKPRLKAVV